MVDGDKFVVDFHVWSFEHGIQGLRTQRFLMVGYHCRETRHKSDAREHLIRDRDAYYKKLIRGLSNRFIISLITGTPPQKNRGPL
jgi:hypothetical protein